MYSKTVMRHFMKPKNLKEIKNPDGIGKSENTGCGDVMELYIKVKNDKIVNACFKTLGCAMAIAASDALCEMIKGKTIKQAEKITSKQVANYLKDVPKMKFHCSILGIETLKKAIDDYEQKQVQ